MTKEEALEILESYAESQIGGKVFPINDVNIKVLDTDIDLRMEIKPLDTLRPIFNDYTFKGLIKIAYNLEDAK